MGVPICHDAILRRKERVDKIRCHASTYYLIPHSYLSGYSNIPEKNRYNMLYREEEREMNKFCNETGVAIIPVSRR